MPKPYVSAFLPKIIFCVLALALSSCGDSDIKLPKLGDELEVPPEVLNEPRSVPTVPLTKDPQNWPLLGNVPTRPRDFTPQATVDAAKGEMESDRADAVRSREEYEAAPPVTPSLSDH